MEDKLVLSCEDIKKRLKPFMEDLLAEDEYQAYVGHLNACVKCKDHVGRFGSLSSQLQELGNIKVPSDFCSAVSFNISEPAAEEPQAPKEKKKNNLIAGIVILVVILAGIFAGVVYFKRGGSSSKVDEPAVVIAQTISEKKTPTDSESEAMLSELQSIAASLGPSGKKEKSVDVTMTLPSADEELPAKEDDVVAPKIRPLHWHFQYDEKSKDDELKKALQRTEIEIQRELKGKEALVAEIELCKQKTEQVEFGKQYSKEDRDTNSNEALQAADELRKKQEELRTLENGISRLKEEKQRAEDLLRQGSGERQRRESDSKGKLLAALAGLNINLSYQNYDILAFTASGEKIKSALQQILVISTASFGDFTANIPTFRDKEQKVSVYLSNGPDSALHWHAKERSADKKADLLNAVRELGGSIEYESDGSAVFSVPNAELKNLRIRIQAMGVSIAEYGSEGSKDGILTSGPVAVSVYFTN